MKFSVDRWIWEWVLFLILRHSNCSLWRKFLLPILGWSNIIFQSLDWRQVTWPRCLDSQLETNFSTWSMNTHFIHHKQGSLQLHLYLTWHPSLRQDTYKIYCQRPCKWYWAWSASTSTSSCPIQQSRRVSFSFKVISLIEYCLLGLPAAVLARVLQDLDIFAYVSLKMKLFLYFNLNLSFWC